MKVKDFGVVIVFIIALTSMIMPLCAQQVGNRMVVVEGGTCIALADDGSVWTWGSNDSGQQALGFATKDPGVNKKYVYNSEYNPRKVEELEDIIFVDTNHSSMLVINTRGEVFTWGWNPNGRLGYAGHSYKPKKVEGLPKIKKATLGYDSTTFLAEDGTVWSVGSTEKGKLAGRESVSKYTPLQIKNFSDVIDISSGGWNYWSEYTLAVKSDGSVWGWGDASLGFLGAKIDKYITVPTQIKGLTDIAKVSTNLKTNVALKKDGTLWIWGDAFYAFHDKYNNVETPIQLKSINNVIDVVSGCHLIIALKSDGTVWSAGKGSYYYSRRMVNEEDLADNNGYAFADNYTQFIQTKELKNIVGISGEGHVEVAISKQGDIYTWGAAFEPVHGKEQAGEILFSPDKIRGLNLGAGTNGNTRVKINGKTTKISSITRQDTTLVELRTLANLLEININYIAKEKKVILSEKDNPKNSVVIDIPKAQITGLSHVVSDAVIAIENGQTYISIRQVGEAFGLKITSKEGTICVE